METLETAQLQERGATAERSSPGLCPSLCRLLEQNTTDWELRNDGNVSLQKPLLLGQPQTPAFFTLRGSIREATWMGGRAWKGVGPK